MFTPKKPIYRRARAWTAAILLVIASLVAANGSAIAQSQPVYTQPDLDRMLAPIALYPDPLLSQILMASTYPIEVVEAARWSRANPGLQGDAAVRAVEDKDWDPSVKSLVAFPDVLARMDENLEWTRQLGDAFLVQEPQVMETVQQLRLRAQAAGTLATDERIRVVNEGRMIVVQPVDPRVIYVPYYDPRLAYGTWWWPAYPPVVWAPWPGYAVRYPPSRPGVAVGFFWGPAVRISVGFFFGAIDWPRREVRVVSVNNYYYRPAIVRRDAHVHEPVTPITVAPGPWRHDPWHRRGVTYRTPEVQQRFTPAAPIRGAARAPMVRQAPSPQSDRGMPRHDERSAVRPAAQPPQQPQQGIAAPRVATPGSVLRTETKPARSVRDEPRREFRQAQPHSNTTTPRSGTSAPAASAVRDERHSDASDAVRRREKRPDVSAPAAREQPQRNAPGERARGGQRKQPESQTGQQHRPPRDGRD